MRISVVIVGSGIAAVSAVLEALVCGAEVTVVRSRPGATALSSGAWDIATDPRRFAGQLWSEISSPLDAVREICRRFPIHPYTLMNQNEGFDLPALLAHSVDRVSSQMGLHLKGSLGQPFLALTPLGTVKTTAYVDRPHAAGNLLEMRDAVLLVVGIKGLPFSSSLASTQLRRFHDRQGFPFCREIRSTEISLKNFPPAFSSMELARLLDEDAKIDLLYESLLREASRVNATHVALPPVIGLDCTNHIFARLAETTSIHWFEILGLPPSLPGLRLQNYLDRTLRSSRITLKEGEAISVRVERRRVLSLKIGGEDLPVERLILATGRFLGGGIVGDERGRIREGLLNLPVFSKEKAGVRIGPQLQPVDEGGRLLYENLWAAGSLLRGYDPATEGCGMGVAMSTGTLAGRLAATT